MSICRLGWRMQDLERMPLIALISYDSLFLPGPVINYATTD